MPIHRMLDARKVPISNQAVFASRLALEFSDSGKSTDIALCDDDDLRGRDSASSFRTGVA